jgi:hypothetical protein
MQNSIVFVKKCDIIHFVTIDGQKIKTRFDYIDNIEKNTDNKGMEGGRPC